MQSHEALFFLKDKLLSSFLVGEKFLGFFSSENAVYSALTTWHRRFNWMFFGSWSDSFQGGQ